MKMKIKKTTESMPAVVSKYESMRTPRTYAFLLFLLESTPITHCVPFE